MKLSEHISSLNDFQRHFGDAELEFWLRDSEKDDDSIELDLHEIHDGYNSDPDNWSIQAVCEVRLSKTDD